MFTIENDQLRIDVVNKGAELQTIFHKTHGIGYLWNGNPAFWAKRSPILFPIVGSLKKDTYLYRDRSYTMGRHGFARDMFFAVEEQGADAIQFLLKADEKTLSMFPFRFEFRVSYRLEEDRLRTDYKIINQTETDMFFSVGGHPAFKLPLVEGTAYDDYYLWFDKKEELSRWPISKDGLIESKPEPLLHDEQLLPLAKNLFLEDALVFKQPASSMISLKSHKTTHGLDFSIAGFPYLGIWAAKNADFVCIEPWCGIADSVDADQQIIHKEGINRLAPAAIFEREWIARFF